MHSTSHENPYNLSQSQMPGHREHVAYSLSQPSPAQQTHSQCDLPTAEQSRDYTTQFPTSQLKSTTHPISPNSIEQWQTVNKKGTEKRRNTTFPLPKKQATG